MKKLLSVLLALVMVLGLATTALAAEDDDVTVSFEKYFYAVNSGTTLPNETFKFKVEKQAFTPYNEGVAEPDPFPMPGTKTDAGYFLDAVFTGMAPIQTPATPQSATVNVSYAQGQKPTVAGEYVYKLTEQPTTTAGITIGKKTAADEADTEKFLRVYVFHNKTGTGVHIAGAVMYDKWPIGAGDKVTEGDNAGNTIGTLKNNGFDNMYEATGGDGATCSFAVKKTVLGQLGDKSRDFDIQVTLTPPQGGKFGQDMFFNDHCPESTSVHSGVYVGEEIGWKIPVGDGTAKTVTVHVKDTETVNFTNVPVGTVITVTETDQTAKDKKYEVKYLVTGDTTTDTAWPTDPSETAPTNIVIASGDKICVEVTNKLDVDIDTGVVLDNLPYVVLLAVVAAGLFLLLNRKRRTGED